MTDLQQFADEISDAITTEARRLIQAIVLADSPEPLTQDETDCIDLGIQAGYAATVRVLIERGVIPGDVTDFDRAEDRAVTSVLFNAITRNT